jgi:capsular polysaccharide biosynthesis protein
MSPHQQARPQQSNNPLIFIVSALFLILLTFVAVFYIDNTDSLTTIKQNQQTGMRTRNDQQQDLTKISCSLWHTMTTSPYVHPSPSTRAQMETLCGP